MQKSDEQLMKKSALVVADEIASIIPGLNIAWGLTKALLGNGLKLRQQKALEWVEMIRDNPKIFNKQLLNEEDFQDGFVYAIERYLTERNENKRQYFRNIFLGFAQANDKSVFPLEKFIHTLKQLTDLDIVVLRRVDITQQGTNYQIAPVNHGMTDNMLNLIKEGLLHDVTGNRIGYPQDSPYVKASSFGTAFIKYIEAK